MAKGAKPKRSIRRTAAMASVPTRSYRDAQFYMHYMVEGRDWSAAIKSYVKKNCTKKNAAYINKVPDWKISMYSHHATTAWLIDNGNSDIVPDERKDHLKSWLDGLASEGKNLSVKKDDPKKNVPTPSIQDRLMEAAEQKTDEIDEWIDKFLSNPRKNPLKDKKPMESFKRNEVNLGHVRWIIRWFGGAYSDLNELISLPKTKLTDEQEQLIEAYSHLTKPQQKELYEFYKRIMDAVEIIRAEKKQNRAPRKRKMKSAADLTKNLKFKSSDTDLGIASVNPTDIVGASTVVIFNCKTRKIGVYYADDHETIQVKGTTLQNFNPSTSVQKTVRKPQEILPVWKKVTKSKIKNNFGNINAVETKMNGRMNEDTIILKTFK